MFGKAKRKEAKATAHPRSGEEALKMQKGLLEKYPDMMKGTGAWGKPAKKKDKEGAGANLRTKAIKRGMGDAADGIKTDEEKRRGK